MAQTIKNKSGFSVHVQVVDSHNSWHCIATGMKISFSIMYQAMADMGSIPFGPF